MGGRFLAAALTAAWVWPVGAMAGSYVFTTLTGAGRSVNDLNQVAGYGPGGGYVWSNGSYALVGDRLSHLLAINDKGLAVGYVSKGKGYGITYELSTGDVRRVRVCGEKRPTAVAVNDKGAILGYYNVSGSQYSTAFLLDHRIATILSPPNSDYTLVAGINDSGTVVGSFADANGVPMFIYANGAYVIVSAPGASATDPGVIAKNGEIGGTYFIPTTKSWHGFVYSGGSFTTIDYPGAVTTNVQGFAPGHEIIGEWTDSKGTNHGFAYVRGTFYPINVPGAAGTYPLSVNAEGTIVGYSVVKDATYFVAICPADQSPCTQ